MSSQVDPQPDAGPSGNTWHDINISGNARVVLGKVFGPAIGQKPVKPLFFAILTLAGPNLIGRSDFVGHYANSSIRPVASYVARPDLQRKIEEQLLHQDEAKDVEARILVVYGLGGAGKSQLVLNYIREHRRDYRGIFWIEAESKETLARDYVQIYGLLCGHKASAEKKLVGLEDAISAVKHWFQSQKDGPWLVVLDSADSIDDEGDASHIDMNFFIPDAPNVHVIITTRSSTARGMTALDCVLVSELESAEAIELFRRTAQITDSDEEKNKEIGRIVQELGTLALAVTLAGSYVSATPRLRLDLSKYLPEYKERRTKLLQQRPKKHIHQYGKSVLGTWETSFEAISNQHPAAARLLSLLAFLNFEDINIDLFSHNMPSGETEESLADSNSSLAEIEEDFSDSEGSPEVDHGSLSGSEGTHSDRQGGLSGSEGSSSHDQDSSAESKISLADSEISLVQSSSHPSGSQDYIAESQDEFSGSRPVWWSYIFQTCDCTIYDLESCFETLQNYSLIQCRANSCSFAMHKLVHAWSFDRLESKIQKQLSWLSLDLMAITMVQKQIEPDDRLRLLPHVMACFQAFSRSSWPNHELTTDALDMVNDLAHFCNHMGRTSEAYIVQSFHASHLELILGKEHEDTLTSLAKLAYLAGEAGEYVEAERIQKQILAARTSTHGTDHHLTFTDMSRLASIYSQSGRFQEAEGLLKPAMENLERSVGQERVETLRSLGNLAMVFYCQGRLYEAEALTLDVLQTQERVLGRQHPETIYITGLLALIFDAKGIHWGAEELLADVIEFQKRYYGHEHPETLHSMYYSASNYRLQGRLTEAENLHKYVMEVQERALGQGHRATLFSICGLGRVYLNEGRLDEAEELFRRSLQGLSKILDRRHPDMLSGVAVLALTIQEQGRHREVISLVGEHIHPRTRGFGSDEPGSERDLQRLRRLSVTSYYAQGCLNLVEKLELQILEFDRQFQGDEHPSTLKSMLKLADTWNMQGRREEAISLLEECAELHGEVFGWKHPETAIVAQEVRMLKAGQQCRERSWDDAEEIYSRVLAAPKQVQGHEHPDTLVAIRNLAEVWDGQGRNEESICLLEGYAYLSTKVFGLEHPDTVKAVRTFRFWKAQQYDRQGRSIEAEELRTRLLKESQEKLGNNDPETLDHMHNLALNWSDQGRFDEAIALMDECVSLRQVAFPEDLHTTHSDIVLQRWKAEKYQGSGHLEKAEELYRQTVTDSQEKLGKAHPETLRNMYHLACSWKTQDRAEEAISLMDECFQLHQRVMPGRQKTEFILHQLRQWKADTYWEQERWDELEDLTTELFIASRRDLGMEHPFALGQMFDLALCIWKGKDREGEAIQLMEECVLRREWALGPHHPDTIASLDRLNRWITLRCYYHGQYEEAEELGRNLLKVSREKGEDEDLLDTAHNLALSIWQVRGRDKEAISLMEDCLHMYAQLYGSEDPETEETRERLREWRLEAASDHTKYLRRWDTQIGQVRRYWNEVEELHYTRLMKTRRKELGLGHPETLSTVYDVAYIRHSQGRVLEATYMMKECLRLMENHLGSDHFYTKMTLERLRIWKEEGTGVKNWA